MAFPEIDEPIFNPRNQVEMLVRRRWIVLAAWLLAMGGGAVYVSVARPVYKAVSVLIIERERGGGGTRSPSAAGVMVDIGAPDYYQTQYELLKSRTLMQAVYDRLELSRIPGFAGAAGVEALSAAVSVDPAPRSRLVRVSAQSGDPKLAVDIANTVADCFVQQNLGNLLFISKDVLQVLQGSPASPHTRRMYEALPAVVGNELIQSLKAQYSALRSEWAQKSQQLTPRHPSMIALKSQIDAVREQIEAETERVVNSLKAELSGQLQGNNVRIVDRAILPTAPSWPRRKRTLSLCAVLGLLAGYLVALLVELVDQSVRTQEDVERKLALPFLGMLPHGRPRELGTTADAGQRSVTGEAFRNLRTMVEFSLVGEEHRALMVTSSVPEEGKTFVSMNLAATYADMGLKVLLIGGDLRRPRLHKLLKVSCERGVSDFLAEGQDVEELEGRVQKTAHANLSALCCGMPPPNPAELLHTPRLGALVRWSLARYDRVVVDCTPLFPISDTLLWGQQVPRAVFVVRHGMTSVPIIRHAVAQLERAKVKILGVAVNSARMTGFAYTHYRYAYSQYYHDYHAEPRPAA